MFSIFLEAGDYVEDRKILSKEANEMSCLLLFLCPQAQNQRLNLHAISWYQHLLEIWKCNILSVEIFQDRIIIEFYQK